MSDRAVTILVVDDNPATLYSTSRVLQSVGYRVLEAGTGAAAVELARGDIDLVVLDINLPDFDGYEVCRRIRAIEKSARVPVVHLSASFVTDFDKVQGLELGADGYLTQPVEPPVLVATVRAFLRVRQSELEREQLLASERAARAEAERANRIKDDFLATVSHELRTPLQSMIGWAQLLKMGDVSPADFAEGLDAIERNAKLQSQMIADLLDVARITSGKLRLDVQPVDLPKVIEAVIRDAIPSADAKGIRITKAVDPSVAPISGDPGRLQQVIWNLLNNAMKFTPDGGEIQITMAQLGSKIEIAVADNGQGIDPELIPKIFERFLQGDSSASRRHSGLGLGLAIARQLIDLHGGTIRAESNGPGTGAKFIVNLPISEAKKPGTSKQVRNSVPESAIASSLDALRLDGIRVLLVDDDRDARRILCRILTTSGAAVEECDGVHSALATILEFKPQILLGDLGMPGQDGFELIRRVRELGGQFETLPAIALTAFARADDRKKSRRAGYQLHLTKPVEPGELSNAIASLVRGTETLVPGESRL